MRLRWQRWLGADPRRVSVLAAGIERSTHGYQILQRENGKAALFDPRTRRVLLVVIGVLASLVLSAFVVMTRQKGPSIGAGVTLFTGLGQALLLLALAPAYLLDHEDARVLGHWPVTARDVAVARLIALARPLRDLTVSFAALPCLLITIFVEPRGAAGLVTALAIVAQGAALLMSFVAVLLLAQRWLGLERARRHVRAVGASLGIFAYVAMQFGSRTRSESGALDPSTLAWIPLFWYATWPLLLREAPAMLWVGFSASVLWLALLAMVSIRLAIAASAPERPDPARGGSTAPDRFLEICWSPWLRRPHGRVLLRVALAHWREDSRFMTQVLSVPLIVVSFVVLLSFLGAPSDEGSGAGASVMLAPVAMLFAVSAVTMSVGSHRPEAFWVVAVAPFSRDGWAAAQRGLARAASLAPMLVGVALVGALAGADVGEILDSMVVTILFFEIAMRAVQMQIWRVPFSRRVMPGEIDGAVVIGAVGIIVLPVVTIWMWAVHEPHLAGKLVTYGLGAVLVAVLRARARSREATEPMRLSVSMAG